MGELEPYKIVVAGIQETKWFGTDVWLATGGYTLLHSDRLIPRNDADGFVSSRLVMARLKWMGKGWQRSQESFVTTVWVIT